MNDVDAKRVGLWMFGLFRKMSEEQKAEWVGILRDFEEEHAVEGIRHYHERADHHGFVDTTVLLSYIRSRIPRNPDEFGEAKRERERLATEAKRAEQVAALVRADHDRRKVQAVIDGMSDEELAEAKDHALVAMGDGARNFFAGRDPRKCPVLGAAIAKRMAVMA